MVVKEGCYVNLYDFTNEEEITYKFVEVKRKTHYVAGHFNYNAETGGVSHNYSAIQVLESGGDGVFSLSKESELGRRILGKSVGEIVEYDNAAGESERFKLLAISEDGISW